MALVSSLYIYLTIFTEIDAPMGANHWYHVIRLDY